MREIWSKLRSLFRRERVARDLLEESNAHFQMEVDANIERGMTPAEALAVARREFGNRTRIEENAREAWLFQTLETFLQDLRYAARSLRTQPGFTAVVVLTLAVGIGANTAIYSVVDATMLRTLPFRDPDRLMRVSMVRPAEPARNRPVQDDMVWSYPKYQTFQDTQQVFESTALYRRVMFSLTGAGEPELLRGEMVSASYFPLLGAKALVGRTFLPEEDTVPERDLVVILSHSLWQRRFGADPSIIGRPIRLDQRNFTVVGVMPPEFRSLLGIGEFWVPVHINPALALAGRWSHAWQQVARLKPGVTIEQARSATAAAGVVVEEAHPNPFGGAWGATARTLDESRFDPVLRKSVLILFGAVAFVLLIACVNVANLLLARAGARRREIAIRCAVGAGRGRVVRQLLTESFLLAGLGGIAGLGLAYAGVEALSAVNDPLSLVFGARQTGLTVLGLGSISLDANALLFTLGAALATAMLFGLGPAWHCSRTDVTDALKKSGERPGSARFLGGKSVLVVAEVALALVLLVGAGLMLKSLGRLLGTQTGVDASNVLTVRMELPQMPGGATASASGFFAQLEERVAALPGVTAAGLSNCHALSGGCNATGLVQGDSFKPGNDTIVGIHTVSPAYFPAMKIPLLRGRGFTAGDREGVPRVVVVSELAARTLWPGEDPIGKVVSVGQGRDFDKGATVVGVVGDVRYGRMDELPQPDVYISHLQSPTGYSILFVRSSGDPLALTQAVRQQVQALNSDLPIYDVKTMETRIGDATARARFSAVLLGLFASVALVLSAIGIYGVMSYAVRQRTREIGIRMALGARSEDMLWLVVRRAAGLTIAGVAIGLIVALSATRVLGTLLYDVKPSDPVTYVAISVMLVAVALLAGYLPARRASAVDPVTTLRVE